jgi:branched-chain amino acid transport system ATP-binding protein
LPDSFRSLLEVEGLVSGYGKKQVLNGVSIEVMEGEIVALIGHNGAGKSTLLKTVFGLLPAWKGQMTLDGKGLTSLPHANCWA